MKSDHKKSAAMATILIAAFAAACYAPPQAPPPVLTRNPPAITIPALGTPIDLDALRSSWDSYPTGYSHTRRRNYQSGNPGSATITPYRGISSVDPNRPPSSPVLFAHIRNFGPGVDSRYNLKPMKVAEYYVIVDADPASPTTSRWRILEVPSAPNGIVSFVQRGNVDMQGHLHHCDQHTPKPVEEADFWNCGDGNGDHFVSFSSATALASAGSMPVGHEFWNNVFSSKGKRAAKVNNGDESAWASCSGGCCTLEF